MRVALYIVWGLLPLYFVLRGIYAALEKVSGKDKHERPFDQFQQAVFTGICMLVAVLIDQYLLETVSAMLIPDWLPLIFWQVVLLPLVLCVAALLVGPSRRILITDPARRAAPARGRKR